MCWAVCASRERKFKINFQLFVRHAMGDEPPTVCSLIEFSLLGGKEARLIRCYPPSIALRADNAKRANGNLFATLEQFNYGKRRHVRRAMVGARAHADVDSCHFGNRFSFSCISSSHITSIEDVFGTSYAIANRNE